MDRSSIIQQIIEFAAVSMKGAEAGHDLWHAKRVWKMACRIGIAEHAALEVIEPAAILHDLADAKFSDGKESEQLQKIRTFLLSLGMKDKLVAEILFVIENVSYSGGFKKGQYESLALRVVQDADRLDAMGAIGVARAFHYGGHKNRPLFIPGEEPRNYTSENDYRNSQASTIAHFHEKLLKLRDGLHTETARKIGRRRHQFLVKYLVEFMIDWDGN